MPYDENGDFIQNADPWQTPPNRVGTTGNPNYDNSSNQPAGPPVGGGVDPWGHGPDSPDYGYETGKGPGSNYGSTPSRDSAIASNQSALNDYYTKNFGRAPKNDEVGDAQRAWELGIPMDQFIQKNVAPRLSNTPNSGSSTQSVAKYSDLMSRIGSSSDPMQQALDRDRLARQVFDDLQAAGHDVNWDKDELVVDGRRYVVGGTAAATAYQPGEIGTGDIPQLSLDDYLARASAQTPVETMADKVVMDVLGDPFGGFDQSYSDNLKAKAKDTAADTWLQEDQSISDMAHQLNQDPLSSPWAASERLGARRSRDMGLAGINTDIDITTQDLRSSKQREAAGLGASYAGQKSQQRLNALTLASDNVFKQAALTGDRMALRESVKQAAASLGLQSDALMRDYIIAKQRELTQRVGLRLGFDIDQAKLDQESSQFKEDLAMRMAQLEELQHEFDANYGAQRDDEAWRRANG